MSDIPRNAELQKWLNLIAFFVLDFIQILFLSSLHVQEADLGSSLIGFFFTINIDIITTILFVVFIYVIRIIVSFYVLRKIFQRPDIFQIYPSIGFNPVVGRFQSDQLGEWTLEIAKKSGIKHLSKVFIARTAIPNAFTVDVSPIPFLLKNSYVVINSNIADILNEAEMKAVIAHELGHIRNSDSIIRMVLSGPHFFLQLAYLYLYLRMLIGSAIAIFIKLDFILGFVRLLVLFVVLILTTFFTDLTINFLRTSNQMAELIADSQALKLMGSNATINMLVKLGLRTQTLEILKREIIWLESRDKYREGNIRRKFVLELMEQFPETEIDIKKVRKEAPNHYLKKLLTILKEQYYLDLTDDPNLQFKLNMASEKLFYERQLYLQKQLGIPKKTQKPNGQPEDFLLSWRELDLNKDESLNDTEIRKLITYIRDDPDFIFINENTENSGNPRNHPSFRKRILNIAKKLKWLNVEPKSLN